MLEMTSDALTNAGKHVTSDIACAHSQQNTNDSVFQLAVMTLCVMTCNFLSFADPNVISDGTTLGVVNYCSYLPYSCCCPVHS